MFIALAPGIESKETLLINVNTSYFYLHQFQMNQLGWMLQVEDTLLVVRREHQPLPRTKA